MKKYLNILLSNYLYYYLIGCFLFILALNIPVIFIVLIVYLIIFRQRYHHLTMMILLVCIFIVFIFTKNIEIENNVNKKFTVIDVVNKENTNEIIVKSKNKKYLIFTFNDYKIGEKILINGDIRKFDSNRIPNGFNRYNYYFSKGIYGEIINYQITKTNEFSFRHFLFNNGYINLDSLLFKFINGFDELEFRQNLKSLNILHLFSISGLHIYLIIYLLKKIFENVNLSNNQQSIIIILTVLIFVLLTNFKTTLIRILIYQILLQTKKIYNLKIDNFSIHNLSFLILLLIYPYLMFNQSTLISYIIITTIILLIPIFNNKNYFLKSLIISIIINLVTLPFNSSINIIGILITPIFNVIIVFIIFPLSFFTYFNSYYDQALFDMLQKLFSNLNKTNYLINIGKLSSLLIVAYFILLTISLILKNNKKILIILLLVILIFSPKIIIKLSNANLYFLDVGQGDSAVFINKDLVIVIDSYHSVGNFLKSKGINTIDYLIVSHSHDDHAREVATLLNTFNVKNLVLNKYDEKNYLTNKIIFASSGLIINNSNVKIEFFNPIINNKSVNDNSLVFKLIFEDTSVLFTGDIEFETEKQLVSYYENNLKSDILKVSHHGSKTSSSDIFIKYVNPDYAVISVASNNKFGFPHLETIQTLLNNDCIILRTDINQTINFRNKKVYLTR